MHLLAKVNMNTAPVVVGCQYFLPLFCDFFPTKRSGPSAANDESDESDDNDYVGGHDDYVGGHNGYVGGHSDYAGVHDDYVGGHGDSVGGQDDFVGVGNTDWIFKKLSVETKGTFQISLPSKFYQTS